MSCFLSYRSLLCTKSVNVYVTQDKAYVKKRFLVFERGKGEIFFLIYFDSHSTNSRCM